MNQLVPSLTNDDLWLSCHEAMRSCRCDGGGSVCGPCQAETRLKVNGVSIDVDNLRHLIDKLAYHRPTVVAAPKTKTKAETTHFNKLTPAQAERLAILAEECGEVVRAVGKILRHGYESFHPNKSDHLGNRNELEMEIGDVLTIATMMSVAKDINLENVVARLKQKRERIRQYAHHQEE